jgi:hypothetical protein
MISLRFGQFFFSPMPVLTQSLFNLNSQTLNNKPEQQWYIQKGNTSIQLADTTLCLDAGAKGE